jgi:hypothetical protein
MNFRKASIVVLLLSVQLFVAADEKSASTAIGFRELKTA